jgi:cell division protein FtsI/penicillin-binding protein 2
VRGKPFTALAALERGLIDPRAQMRCEGSITFGKRTFRCTHVHGAVDLRKAMAESCNVYFFNLAADYGVGIDLIAELANRFGFGGRTGLGVNAEVAGRVPTRAWMTLHNKGRYQLGFGLNAAIGQGATTVTLLQLALAYAALANGGSLYEPQLVRAVETSNGTVVRDADTERTWYFNRDHALFAGYAPADAPEVAVVALVEHGGFGGKRAAPIAFEVVRAYQASRRAGAKPDAGATSGGRKAGRLMR